jgi:acyl dehydratase
LASLFSSLSPGDRIPELVRGPMSSAHVVRWSAAMENWHRIHYDLPFAREHDKLPGLVINGSWKQYLIVQMIRRWAEPEGWLYKVGFQFRAMNLVGSTLTAWGEVTELSERDSFGYVSLAVGIRDEHGVESTPGTGLVVMPLSTDNPVPYPFHAHG